MEELLVVEEGETVREGIAIKDTWWYVLSSVVVKVENG